MGKASRRKARKRRAERTAERRCEEHEAVALAEQEAEERKSAARDEIVGLEGDGEVVEAAPKKSYKSRVCEVRLWCYDSDGKPTDAVERAEAYIEGHYGLDVVRASLALHDRDTYQKWQEIEADKREPGQNRVKAGKPVPAHVHLALEHNNQKLYSAIGKQIGLREGDTVQRPKAKYDQFEAISAYSSHQDPVQIALGKHPYAFDSIKTWGFDYEGLFKGYMAKKRRRRRKEERKAELSALVQDVYEGRKTKQDIIDEYGFDYYATHEKKFNRARTEFLRSDAFAQKGRLGVAVLPDKSLIDAGVNPSGVGKTALSREIAMRAYPGLQTIQTYHEITDQSVAFDEYDEQPVLIMEEVRGDLAASMGRGKFFALTDPHPGKGAFGIKFGHAVVVSELLIINGIDPHEKLFSALAGEYTDRFGREHEAEAPGQVRRRFPLVVSLGYQQVRVLANKAVFLRTDDPNDVFRYIEVANIAADVPRIIQGYEGEALRYALGGLLDAVIAYIDVYWAMQINRESDPSNVPDEVLPVVRVRSLEDVAREEAESLAEAHFEAEAEEQLRVAVQLETELQYEAAVLFGEDADELYERYCEQQARRAEAKAEAEKRERANELKAAADRALRLEESGFILPPSMEREIAAAYPNGKPKPKAPIIFDPTSQGL